MYNLNYKNEKYDKIAFLNGWMCEYNQCFLLK